MLLSIHFHQHKFLRLISRRRHSGLFALHPSLILNLPADFETCFASSDWIRIRIGRRSSEIIRNSCTSWQKIQNRASEASAPLSRLADRDRSRISKIIRCLISCSQIRRPNSPAKLILAEWSEHTSRVLITPVTQELPQKAALLGFARSINIRTCTRFPSRPSTHPDNDLAQSRDIWGGLPPPRN